MPKIRIMPAKDNSFYCTERLSVGVYLIGKKAVLIDSGIDNDTAKAIDAALKQQDKDITVTAIINTHSHADHCGGNSFFQKKYPGLKVYSTKFEQHYIEDSFNEPTCFCMGAEPLAELRSKYYLAPPSNVTHVIAPYQDQTIEIDGAKFSIMALPGHTRGMIGVVTPDNVLYTGDAIFGPATFAKHGILFYMHIGDTIKSLKRLETLKTDGVVFYHGGLMQGTTLDMVARQHIERLEETKALVLQFVQQESLSLPVLTQKIIQHYNKPHYLNPHTEMKIAETAAQFTLTEACVLAYISDLQRENKLTVKMENALKVFTASGTAVKTDKADESTRLAPPSLSH